ncbi:MAG: Holliday junction resolvase RuvX [Actinomycetota bacterium]
MDRTSDTPRDEEAAGPPGRVLGLDLGDARIGVAVSDPDRRVAVPHGTVRVGQPPGELKAVAALVGDLGISVVVVGHPRSMSGASGPRAQQAEAFADALRAVVAVPVELQDERLSTVEAERALREAGIAGRRRREVVDESAAVVILGAWLDAQR